MLNVIACPTCKAEIEVSEIMAAQLSATIRAEMEDQLATERRSIGERARQVQEQEQTLQEERGKFELQIQARLAEEQQRLLAEARAQVSQELSVEIAARDGKLQDLQKQLQTARSAELDLLRREGELQSQREPGFRAACVDDTESDFEFGELDRSLCSPMQSLHASSTLAGHLRSIKEPTTGFAPA